MLNLILLLVPVPLLLLLLLLVPCYFYYYYHYHCHYYKFATDILCANIAFAVSCRLSSRTNRKEQTWQANLPRTPTPQDTHTWAVIACDQTAVLTTMHAHIMAADMMLSACVFCYSAHKSSLCSLVQASRHITQTQSTSKSNWKVHSTTPRVACKAHVTPMIIVYASD